MLYEALQGIPVVALGAVIFLLGSVIGSFLNVVRTRESWHSSITGRSQCGSCNKTLTWIWMLPIVSYLILRGRCASCGAHIPVHHLYAEVLFGFAFLSAFFFSDSVYIALVFLIAVLFLLPIVLTDIEKLEVPEQFSVPFTFVSFGIACFVAFSVGSIEPFISGGVLALPFFLLWYCSSGRAMGLGDAKVALPLGLLLPTWHHAVSVFLVRFGLVH